jgi:hypothetical protein
MLFLDKVTCTLYLLGKWSDLVPAMMATLELV